MSMLNTNREPAADGASVSDHHPDRTEHADRADRPSVTLDDVSFAYGGRLALAGVRAELRPGTMVGLIGANGAGKSTLLRLMMGLAKPSAGEVRIGETAVGDFGRRALARLVAWVPQDSRIDYAFSVEEIVAMGRHPHRRRFQAATREDADCVARAMAQTQVAAFAARPVSGLSGGERQRVLIARAIAQQTPVILLDEATANLDLCHQLEVLALARSLAGAGRLVVCAIHDLAMASRFCDRLLLLHEGRLCEDGPPGAVLTPAHLARYFKLRARVEADAQGDGLHIVPLAALT